MPSHDASPDYAVVCATSTRVATSSTATRMFAGDARKLMPVLATCSPSIAPIGGSPTKVRDCNDPEPLFFDGIYHGVWKRWDKNAAQFLADQGSEHGRSCNRLDSPLNRRNKYGTKADTFVVVPIHCPVQILLRIRVEFNGKRHYGSWRVKAPANT